MTRTTYRVYERAMDDTWDFVFQSPHLADARTYALGRGSCHIYREYGTYRIYRYDITPIQDEHKT